MKLIYAILFILTITAAGFSQSPSKILKQAEKAMGGNKAIQSVRSISKTGSIKRLGDGAEGKYIYQASQPSLLNINYDLAGFEVESGYNGRSGWSRTSREGLQTLTGKSSVDLIAKAFYRNNLWLKAKDEKAKITPGIQANIEGKPASGIVITTQKGIAIKLWFDNVTGLLVRDELPNGDTTEVTDYSDYRDVNGMKQAFTQKLTVGDEIYEIHLTEIKVNPTIAASEFSFPVMSSEALPDIPTLLKDLQANEDKVDAMLDTYSFTQKSTQRELGKDGVLREKESETVQLSFVKGKRVSRVIEKNGKPLTEKEQAEADKDAAKRVDDIEKQAAKDAAKSGKQGSNGPATEQSRRISLAELLHASKLLNPRRERFKGRDVIVFDFEPNPAFDLSGAKSRIRFFGKTAGVMWIDEKDKQVARVEAVLADSIGVGGGVLAKLQKGASFTMEKERVGDEIWLPSQYNTNLGVRILLLKTFNVNLHVKYYGYRKFETEVKDAKVGDDKKP